MKEILIIVAIFGGALAHHKVHLIPAHIICPNTTAEHDILIPSPLDCAVYYRCQNGMAIPSNCPPGLEWCQVLSQCTLPVIANCTIGHSPVTYAPGEPIPEQVTPSPSANSICPVNGVTLPDPVYCHKYYQCLDDTPVSEECPENEAYSCWDQQCVNQSIAQCFDSNQTGTNCSVEEVLLPNKEDCNSYYRCVNGKVVLTKCPENENYNSWSNECVPPQEANCSQFVIPSTTEPPVSISTLPTTSPIVTPNTSDMCPIIGATLPDVSDCTKYYECDQNGEPVRKSCPDNEAYSCWDQQCENTSIAQCFNSNSPGENCSDAEVMLPNKEDCSSYYQCVNGQVALQKCPEGENYNAWSKKCVSPQEANCGPFVIPSTTEPIVSISTLPTTSPSVTPNPSVMCPMIGATLPDVSDCTKYYECDQNGEPVSKSCPDNKAYSCWDQQCVNKSEANCLGEGTEVGAYCSYEGSELPNPNDCGSYYKCKDKQVGLEKCAEGQGYYAWNGTCVLLNDAHCDEFLLSNTSSRTTESTVPTVNITHTPTGENTPSISTISTETTSTTVGPVTPSTNPTTESTGTPTRTTESTVPSVNITHTPTGETTPSISTISKETTTAPVETTTHSSESQTSPSTEQDICPADGAKIPNPVNCTSYYICEKGIPTSQDCPEGQEYSCWDQECKTVQQSTCIKEGSQQGNNCSKDQNRLPNLENCNSYYECVNNTIELKYCPINMYYNKWFEGCFENNLAWCETYPVITPNSTMLPPIPTIPPSSDEDLCPIGGARLPNILDCTSYYICEGTNPVSVQCPLGQAYSCWYQTCLPLEEAHCIGQETNTGDKCGIDELKLPNIKNCSSYYECEKGEIVEKHCPDHLEYNSWFEKCIINKSSHCKVVSTSTVSTPTTVSIGTPTPGIDSCPINGKLLADPSDCTKYYECENFKGVPKECPVGKSFNAWTHVCEKSNSDNNCITGVQADQNCSVSTEIIPNVLNCGSYYVCVEGKVELQLCAAGSFYNKWFKTCVSFDLAFCFTFNTPTLPTAPTAPVGGFDICPIDHALIPNAVDCTMYYECIDFTPMLQSCPPGLAYSCWDQKCENSTEASCILSVSSGHKCSDENLTVQDVTDCSSYYICSKGTTEKKHCPLGMEFNSKFHVCTTPENSHCRTYTTLTTSSPALPTSPITPSPVDVCPSDGIQIPNPVNCSTYYKCEKGSPTLQECADGLQYSCWDMICLPPAEANCISEVDQTGMPCSVNGQKSQDPQDCHSYYECVHGTAIPKKCSRSWYFNNWFKVCVPFKILAHCKDPVTVTPQPTPAPTISPDLSKDLCPMEGATLPNPILCNHYYECQNESAVDKTCPLGEIYSCWDQQCLSAKKGKCITSGITEGSNCSRDMETLQDMDSCSSYYGCVKGKVQKLYCPIGKKYNKWFGKCVWDLLAHCQTYTTTNQPTTTLKPVTIKTGSECGVYNSTIPNPRDCHSYYQCKGNFAVLENCPEGYNYDCVSQECNLSLFTRCVNVPTAIEGQPCSKEKETIPDAAHCSKYYECRGKVIKHKSCPNLQSYSVLLKRCVLTPLAFCTIFGIPY